ncbi:6089_t:CDS:2, partial [Acaulospora morrowiae]
IGTVKCNQVKHGNKLAELLLLYSHRELLFKYYTAAFLPYISQGFPLEAVLAKLQYNIEYISSISQRFPFEAASIILDMDKAMLPQFRTDPTLLKYLPESEASRQFEVAI